MKLIVRVAAGILLAGGALYSVNSLRPDVSFGTVELYTQRHRERVFAEIAKQEEAERAVVTTCHERHPDERDHDAYFDCIDAAGLTTTDRANRKAGWMALEEYRRRVKLREEAARGASEGTTR